MCTNQKVIQVHFVYKTSVYEITLFFGETVFSLCKSGITPPTSSIIFNQILYCQSPYLAIQLSPKQRKVHPWIIHKQFKKTERKHSFLIIRERSKITNSKNKTYIQHLLATQLSPAIIINRVKHTLKVQDLLAIQLSPITLSDKIIQNPLYAARHFTELQSYTT